MREEGLGKVRLGAGGLSSLPLCIFWAMGRRWFLHSAYFCAGE